MPSADRLLRIARRTPANTIVVLLAATVTQVSLQNAFSVDLLLLKENIALMNAGALQKNYTTIVISPQGQGVGKCQWYESLIGRIKYAHMFGKSAPEA